MKASITQFIKTLNENAWGRAVLFSVVGVVIVFNLALHVGVFMMGYPSYGYGIIALNVVFAGAQLFFFVMFMCSFADIVYAVTNPSKA